MKRGLKIVALFLLSAVLINLTSAANIDDFKKSMDEAAYYAGLYHGSSLTYTQFLTYLSATKDKINTLLSQKEDPITSQKIESILGKAQKETSWIKNEVGGEKDVETLHPIWENPIFDGKIQLKYNLFPVIDSNGQVYYNIDFSVNFKEAKPTLDLKNALNEIEINAKGYSLIKPEDVDQQIMAANKLAASMVTLKNLFKDYSAQSAESCEETMKEILGENTLTSQQKIVEKEITVLDQDRFELVAAITTCEDECEGLDAWNWIDLSFKMEKDNQPVVYIIDSPTTEEEFSSMETNGFKQEFIDTHSLINKLADAKNYPAVYSLVKRLEVINYVWDKKANEGLSNEEKLPVYVDRIQFFNKLWEGLPDSSSVSDQTTFEKVLVQEINSGSEEICTNNIDDNSNQKVDCEDNFCSGQYCGSKTIESTEGNQTTSITTNLYCSLGQCVPQNEAKNETSPVCGNKICEAGEAESCSSDCQTCQTYPPIECSGEVIFKGKDTNDCPLEPICIEKTTQCTENSDCIQPLCGKSQCVLGECKITDLGQCQEQKCTNGEEKIQKCNNGETILSEICSNNVWRATGANCNQITAQPIAETQILENQKSSCKMYEDCSSGYVCSNSQCVIIPEKKTSQTPSEQAQIKGISSVTGQAVIVTGELSSVTGGIGITTTVGEPIPQSDVNKYKSLQKEQKPSAGPNWITGISPEPNPIIIAEVTQAKSEEILLPGETEKVVARGVCIETAKETKSLLYVTGGGEKFQGVINLEQRFTEDGTEAYCGWQLKNALAQREEFVAGMRNFAQWFSEYFHNSANNWESESQTIEYINQNNIENLAVIAQAIQCLNMKELDSYQLVSAQYEDENIKLDYQETLNSVNGIKIPSPTMQLIIFPNREFIKQELQNDVNIHRFPGSPENAAERNRLSGLTAQEINGIKNDPALVEQIGNLASQYPDETATIQVKIVDKQKSPQETVYNMLIKIDSTDLIKVQVLREDEMPPVDSIAEIGYSQIYNLLYTSAKSADKTYAPWEANKFRPGEIISNTISWFSLLSAKNSFSSSITVTPSKSEGEIKSMVSNILAKISEVDKAQKSSTDTQIIWNTKGQKISVA